MQSYKNHHDTEHCNATTCGCVDLFVVFNNSPLPHANPPPRNWVDTIILSCCSSQSAELSAESGHMSYLGSMFSFFFFSYPPRVKIQEAGP